MRREASNLDVHVLLAPKGGNSRQPVLLFDRCLCERPIVGREYARRGRELRTGDFAPHGARCNSHLRIIPDALVFPGVAARLHLQLVISFSKPDGRCLSVTDLAEGGEADVFLALNVARDGHRYIVRERDQWTSNC